MDSVYINIKRNVIFQYFNARIAIVVKMNILLIVSHCLVAMVIAMPSLMKRQLEGNLLENQVLCENKNKYLSDYTSGGRKAYSNLQDAQTACTKITDCGGITQEPLYGNQFTLRKGTTLKESPSGETSWTKGACDVVPKLFCENKDKYLSGYTYGGRKAYGKLQDAQTACTKTTDCGGITQEPLYGNQFTLRKGTTLKESPSGETSWNKGACDVECSAGEYKSANGSCEICPKDSYSSDGASHCTPCPYNTVSGEGSTSIDACQSDFDCTSCKPELNEVCQNEECTCSSCNVRGTDDICVKKYQIEYTTLRLYDDAQIQCKSLGLDLATINSEEDSSAFKAAARLVYGDNREKKTYNSANWIWIGATDLDVEGEYRFQNGDYLNFTAPWARNQPDHKPIGGLVVAPCIQRNQDYYGSDLGHTTAFSRMSQCVGHCLSFHGHGHTACLAIVWQESTKGCWFKHSVPALRKHVGILSVNMSCMKSQPLVRSMGQDQRHVAVSRWGEWDDSFGNYFSRAFACSC